MDDDLDNTLRARRELPGWARAALVVGLLYLFLVGVKLLESGIKGVGSEYTDALFGAVSSPLSALFVGILTTVLVQSSSVTTATIVGLVAAGVVGVDTAVYMVMGANIGTSVTNTLVSLTNVRRTESFQRAFTAATMHDFFNLIAVAILFPLELLTGFLSGSATVMAEWFPSTGSGGFRSPIKSAVSWGADLMGSAVEALVGETRLAAVLVAVLGLAIIFLALSLITKNMRVLVAARIETSLNAALARSGLVGIVVGTIVTISVQSSSITTSILVPLVASGVLLVRNAYPITLGANIGTTVTAFIAALGAGSVDGLTVALTHTLFNVIAILILYPIPRLRFVPVRLAEGLSAIAVRRKWVALAYVVVLFIVVPFLGIIIF
jgi:sodium-dependent phosphate cotransporter